MELQLAQGQLNARFVDAELNQMMTLMHVWCVVLENILLQAVIAEHVHLEQ